MNISEKLPYIVPRKSEARASVSVENSSRVQANAIDHMIFALLPPCCDDRIHMH